MENHADPIAPEDSRQPGDAQPPQDNHVEALIDEASEDSFPASDPPAFGPIIGVGRESTSTDE